ncbi:AbiJ-NTD4 domain-containing protein [Methylibium sp.]|jgi:hypothetical protein|uniref:AbiJ-NTD4 domain-containing protein n=1 Tax=Methylibium sp. TaxID=2067992 RepID=UPI003D0D2E3B
MSTFSSRHGYQPPDAEITTRHEAPEEFRGVLVSLAYEAGLGPKEVRSSVCALLHRRENPDNWSPFPNIDNEIRRYVDECEWYEVYDVAEALYARLTNKYVLVNDMHVNAAPHFESELNRYFRRRGIGWAMLNGRLEARGSEAFESTLKVARQELWDDGRRTASNEIHEALTDLSRRPEPDVTGAIQHALAALECVARDVTGDPKATLGQILARNPGLLPAPLDQALEKLWGFASEQGRHLREGREPAYEEAEVAVHVAAAAARYLSKKLT